MDNFQFEIKGKKYTTETMNVGRFVDLWAVRSTLSRGTYGQIYRNALIASDEALLMIDIQAFFTVFCPTVLNDLKPASIGDMGLEDYSEIKEIYVSQIKPWLDKINAMLQKPSDV